MLNKLKEAYQNKYSKESLKTLEEIESTLKFEKFDSYIALEVGNKLVETSKYYGEVAIIIIREKDEQCIFQFVGNGKTIRNIDFAMKKRNTVVKTKHCSLWALVKEVVDGGCDDVFNVQNDCLPVGGAFPVLIDGELVATIAVSGLKNGADQLLIVEALSKYLNKSIIEFKGQII